jgi:hypothetical protein
MKEGSTIIQSFEIGAATPSDNKDASKKDKENKK